MKNKRTIRTMKRAGINAGFAGWLPSGKAVRKLARALRAEREAVDALCEAGYLRASGMFARMSPRRYAKAVASFLAAPKDIRDAWVNDVWPAMRDDPIDLQDRLLRDAWLRGAWLR